jgi:FO synthase
MEEIIRGIGRAPWQRTTLYVPAAAERMRASFGAPPLIDVINRPATKYANVPNSAAAE